MANERLYKCYTCSMIYWGHELLPHALYVTASISGVPCPTPWCHGNSYYSQATPFEAARTHGMIVGVLVGILLPILLQLNIILSVVLALATGVATFIISNRFHQPASPYDDQIYAAKVMTELGESFDKKGQYKEARYAFGRALSILGAEVNLEWEAAILGRLANAEKWIGDFASARPHYERAIALAEQIGDISGLVNRLHNLAAMLGDDLRDPISAIPLLERAVTLSQKLDDPIQHTRMLFALAKREREAGRYEQAHAHAGQAVINSRKTGNPAITAEALWERASVALAESKNMEAAEDLRLALKTLGCGFQTSLSGAIRLTRPTQVFGQMDRASMCQSLREALTTVEAANRAGETVAILPPGQAASFLGGPAIMSNINPEAIAVLKPASEHAAAERLVLAAESYTEALQTDSVQSDPRAKALAESDLGNILRMLGRLDEALVVLRDALAIARQFNDTQIEYGTLLNLGIVLRQKGLLSESQQSLERTIVLAREQHDLVVQGRAALALGTVFRDGLEFQLAEDQYRRAEELARESGDVELQSSIAQSWGNFFFKQKRWQEAIPHYEKALELARQQGYPRLQGTALNMLGTTHKRLGHLELARDLIQQSISIEGAVPDELGLAARLVNLATTEQQLRKSEQARLDYERAIRIYHKNGITNFEVAGGTENLGVLLVRLGETSAGAEYILSASRMDNEVIPEAFAIASEETRLEVLLNAESRLNDLISLIAQGGKLEGNTVLVQTCADIVIRRKGITLEALAIQREIGATGDNPEIVQTIRKLNDTKMELARLWSSASMGESSRSDKERSATLIQKKAELERKLAQAVPRLELEQRLNRADRQALSKMLPAESVLIEFIRFNFFAYPPADQEAFWSPPRYAAFVLLAGDPDGIRMIDLGEAESIDKLIEEYREEIVPSRKARGMEEPEPISDITDGMITAREGSELRTVVFERLVPALNGRTRIFLAPDGDLTRLPFEVLPLGDRQYLIDEYHITYLSTGRDVLRFGQTFSGQATFPVVIANPDFDRLTERTGTFSRPTPIFDLPERFAPLEGTEKEGEQIGKMVKVEPIFGKEAVEARIKQIRSPHILHFATHGHFVPDQKRDPNELRVFGMSDFTRGEEMGPLSGSGVSNPLLRSMLILAGYNTWRNGGDPGSEAEDGLLTAEDVSSLDLLATELVVLSACDTGLGEIRTGEGVFGLRRAFVLAGAKTLVMSLWKVPDQQTQELMVEFYQRLRDGEPRAEALRNAQLAMKKNYPHPRWWGAFICQGEPGTLEFK